MVFTAPSWVPELGRDPPDSISISQFMYDEAQGRTAFTDSRNLFTCGVSGKTYTVKKIRERAALLARALSSELGMMASRGREWDKVLSLFTFNTIDFITVVDAIHDLGGIASPASAAYSATELEFQLKSSGSKALFTCLPLLEVALQAAERAGISNKHVYLVELPKSFAGDKKVPFKTVNDLIAQGSNLPPIEPLKFSRGQGMTQTAFLCYSSGTSGLPKGVMISHRNVISNVMQMEAFFKRRRNGQEPNTKPRTKVVSGLMPQSHIYGLVGISYLSAYLGDEVIILPKFELQSYLKAVQDYQINTLFLVPPIIILIINNRRLCSKYDLSSVHAVLTGAAPLGRETAEELQTIYPSWKIQQGYGLTETCAGVCLSSDHDIWFGTSGSLFPGVDAKLMSSDGIEITKYDQPGELLIQSPSVVLGYLNDKTADLETFMDDPDGKGRWLRTGDEAIFSVAPSGNEHVIITERIKELIKVKGLQLAPAELEAHLLTHPFVADAAVIPVPDDVAGEVPKAYVVKSSPIDHALNDILIASVIQNWVQDHKSRHKWLEGGIEFIDVVPKSASGKILRRVLREKEKETRKKMGLKL